MPLRVALGQFNASVGDIDGNINKMRSFISRAQDINADLLIFPEMCVCGYPPEDLLHKPHFLEDSTDAIHTLAKETRGMAVVTGFPEVEGSDCYNSLALMRNGKVEHIYRKCILPNYGVFDEKRYFKAGKTPLILDFNDLTVVFTICEDIWNAERLERMIGSDVKPDMIVNLSASPFQVGKLQLRREVIADCTRKFDCTAAYCNLVGGQDELVFDGRSMFFDPDGKVVCQAKAFEEDLLVADVVTNKKRVETVNISGAENAGFRDLGPTAEAYEALVLGLRDYVNKNGFRKVLIGLSGGIDSSLTAVIAVEAIGAENLIGITMPSKFNTEGTISDAGRLAENLGIEFETISISDILESFNSSLSIIDGWDDKGTAYENLQARIRGTLLMSLSNQFNTLVITCGNKSETAVGYSTLYGDTAGGFAVIKDVPKTMVYDLSRYVNEKAGREIIPVSVIERPPSAELKPDQQDTDSLPDYDKLDAILRGYVEEDKSADDLIAEGNEEQLVRRIVRLVDLNEYKRRQSPPGLKITPKAFGRDRRMPITNKYR